MGMIDKEKLWKFFYNRPQTDYKESEIVEIIKSFPEQPPIDFDALYDEFKSINGLKESSCFRDFLTSKNIYAPAPVIDKYAIKCDDCGGTEFKFYNDKVGLLSCTECGQFFDTVKKRELPVKTTWKLKEEFYEFAINMFQPISLNTTTDKEPKHKQYYDKITEVDYSKLSKGDIVEFIYNHHKKLGWVERVDSDYIFVNCLKINFKDIIRVVEWGNE